MRELSYLNKYLFKYKKYYLLGTGFILISTFFALVPATLIRETFDLIEEGVASYSNGNLISRDETLEYVLIYAGGIILAAVIRGLFMYMMRQTIIVASRNIEYDLKNEIFFHYQTLPSQFYKENNTGDLMNRISEDVSRVRMYIGPALMYGMNVTILMLTIIPFMFYINSKLAFYSIIPLPLLVLSIYYVQNIINKRSEEIQESLSDLSTYVQETFSGIRLIKSFVREENFSSVFSKKSVCLLYTSDAADDETSVDLGGRRIIKKIFFKQKTAYEICSGLVGSEMCIRDSSETAKNGTLRWII